MAELLSLEVSGSAGTITTLNGGSAERYAAELKMLRGDRANALLDASVTAS